MLDTVAPALQPAAMQLCSLIAQGYFLALMPSERISQFSIVSASSPQALANALLTQALGTELGANTAFQGSLWQGSLAHKTCRLSSGEGRKCHGLCMWTWEHSSKRQLP